MKKVWSYIVRLVGIVDEVSGTTMVGGTWNFTFDLGNSEQNKTKSLMDYVKTK